jgi:serine/threonine-protein kinase
MRDSAHAALESDPPSQLALHPGARFGPYEISAPLGAGGMGEVYRARDPKLGRDVALKVLPDAVAADPDRIARFEREAKTLAALNHTNIAHIYGLEESNGASALVMELVEGPTLADRIAAGSLPIDETLPIAKQIAEALEVAHEQGIVHRDLKPANIKLRPDGTVKVLDFGLAKAFDPVASNVGGATMSPTLSIHATQVGIILGTAAYMAPEQARGKTVDRRADIWAYGAVVFEMVTGHAPFPGEDTSHVLARVIERDPDWTLLPPAIPSTVRRLLMRCLTKDPKDRLQAIGDARIEIGELLSGRAPEAPDAALVQQQIAAAVAVEKERSTAAQQRSEAALSLMRRRLTLSTGAVAVIGAIVAVAAWTLKPTAPPPVTRFTIALGEGQQFSAANHQSLSMSPDGAEIVYSANGQFYLRSMRDLDARAIAGTQQTPAPLNPVFSPDGRAIAFFSQADGTIKRIAASGGAAVTICPAATPFLGMSWSGGELLFGQTDKGILRVSDNGGQPHTLIAAKNHEVLYGPQMLPGGEWVLFTSAATATSDGWDKAQIFIQSVKSSERKPLISGGSDARYLPTGHIIYALGGVEYAVPFDLGHLAVNGSPVSVVEGVKRSLGGITGTTHLAASDTGSLAFESGPTSAMSQSSVALIDRTTGAIQPLPLPSGAYEYPRASPDGRRIAFGSDVGVVWIYELSGANQARRLTVSGHDRFPVWVDNDRVAFQSDRDSDLGIFWQRADGTTPPQRLTKPDDKDTAHIPESWSPDGKTLLFAMLKKSIYSLAELSIPEKTMIPFAGITSALPIASTFSPDGKWVAYTTAALGGLPGPLFVQPFPPTGATYPISKGTGLHPLWSPDGKELIYSPGPNQLVSISVTTRPTFTFGNPTPIPRAFIERGPPFERNNDILPDGRLLGTVPVGSAGSAPTPQIQVVLNWFEELKTRVPTK